MARDFNTENLKKNLVPYWWVAIEGIRYRYGHDLPSWNPADSGVNQHIQALLARVPQIGGQEADPLNGSCTIPSHQFSLADDGTITDLVSVANTPKNKTFLTAKIAKGQSWIAVGAIADFPSVGDLFIDRETIHYTGKSDDDDSAICEQTSGTAETDPAGASKIRVHDDSFTEVNDFWVGALLTFTGGTNTGEVRRVVRSTGDDGPLKTDEYFQTLYLDPCDPLPANVANGDTFTITQAPRRMKDSGFAGAGAGFWDGALIIVDADTDNPINVGEVRWVKSFFDDGTFELYEPLPEVALATEFTLVKKRFTGITRGLYGSLDVDHEVIDDYGTPVIVDVVDRPPFLKTRKVWFFENRAGCAEAQAKMRVGIIDDWLIEPDGKTFTFKCSGMMKVLANKVLANQKKGKVAHAPVWGGVFKAFPYYDENPGASSGGLGVRNKVGNWPVMEDAAASDFVVTEVFYDADEPFDNPCNVKIDDEILRATEQETFVSSTEGFHHELVLAPHIDFAAIDVAESDLASMQAMVTADKLGLPSRALFAEKIGFYVRKPIQIPEEDWPAEYPRPKCMDVAGFIQEHEVGAEVAQVCLCDGSDRSDFPRYDRLLFSGGSGTMGTLPATVTGGRSGITATIMAHDATNGYLTVIRSSGDFQVGETLTGGTSWTGTCTEHRKGDGNQLPARNNALSVVLQLMMSSGTLGQNGIYDVLPLGWGLALTEDEVDVDSIEDLRARIFSKTNIDFVIHEPTSFKEWCESNIFRLLQVFPFETPEGLFSLAYLYTESECQALELLGDHMGHTLKALGGAAINAQRLPDWTSGQMPIAKVVVEHNKHPATDDYFGKMEIVFARAKRYFAGQGRTVVLDAGTLYVQGAQLRALSPNNPELPELVSRIINPMWGRHGSNPCPVVSVEVPYNWMDVDIGAIAKFTHPSLPNLRTGLRGLTDEYFQVIASEPMPTAGMVRLVLWQVGVHDTKYGRVAPSGIVDHIHLNTPVLGKTTITLKEGIFAEPSIQATRDFLTSDSVMFLSADYQLLGGSSPEVFAIYSKGVSGHTLVITGLPTYAPTEWCWMEVAPYDSSGSTRKSTTVFTSDSERVLGAAAADGFKYM